jgi:hypothetical protein
VIKSPTNNDVLVTLVTVEMPDGVCVWSWGAGTYGQLGEITWCISCLDSLGADRRLVVHGAGHRETWDAWLPRSIDEIRRESIRFIDAGERHSLAISDSRRLWLWGKGVHGEQEVATPDPTNTCMVQPIVVWPKMVPLHCTVSCCGYDNVLDGTLGGAPRDPDHQC